MSAVDLVDSLLSVLMSKGEEKTEETAEETEVSEEAYACDAKEAAPEPMAECCGPKPQVVFVLGGPGSGKGTQCAKIVEEFGFKHLSAGDLLRRERDSGSEKAKLINDYIREGEIVPVAITVALIKAEMSAQMEVGHMVFIIDGFPRNEENLKGWFQVMDGFAEVAFVMYLECSESSMTARILSRASKSAIDVRRVDDTEAAIRKRLAVYSTQTLPVISAFKREGLVYAVSADSSDIDAIYRSEVRQLFLPFAATPKVVFVLGGPGSGKGTQCAKVVAEFGCKHLSAGDLLRAERSSDSKDAKLINDHIAEGTIVPVQITVNLIKKAMLAEMRVGGGSTFVIDGFPRNFDNLQGWDRTMAHFCEVPFLLFLKCTEAEMTKRILERASLSDVTRIDDNVEALRKRFRVYLESTMPVVDCFRKKGDAVEVDAIGAVDDVYKQIRPHFQHLFEEH